MSYLSKKQEEREDEMNDLAFVKRDVEKIYAFKYRGHYDEIPYAFKRDLVLIDDDVSPNVIRHEDKTNPIEFHQNLMRGMFIILRKDGYTQAMGAERFNDMYRPTADFHRYE